MRRRFAVLLIFGMVAVSEAAFADSILDGDLVEVQEKFKCCDGATGILDLHVTFSANLTGIEFPSESAEQDCKISGNGTDTATLTCKTVIPIGHVVVLTAMAPEGATLKSACWSTPAKGHATGEACTPATPIPEPQSMVLLASGLLTLPMVGAIRRKIRM